MGGVPTPTPEIEDLLARAKFSRLAHQLKIWALNKRKPWPYLLFEASRGFFPSALVGVPKHMRPAPWLNPNFVKRNRAALQGYETRVKLFGPLPTFQQNVSTLVALQRQLGCCDLPSAPPYEKCYPYLDRGLLEFIYAIPREQLVRPGQRRSLMRRALVGIVPKEVIDRKRKAYGARSPLAAIVADWSGFGEMTQDMVSSSLGIVDSDRVSKALQNARQGQNVRIVCLIRSVSMESWLRKLRNCSLLSVALSEGASTSQSTHIKWRAESLDSTRALSPPDFLATENASEADE